jgi:hypothetical protein
MRFPKSTSLRQIASSESSNIESSPTVRAVRAFKKSESKKGKEKNQKLQRHHIEETKALK